MGSTTVRFESVVSARVKVASRPSRHVGARDVPLIRTQFISAHGESLTVTSSMTDAAATLTSLIDSIKQVLPDLGHGRERAGAGAVSDAADRDAPESSIELDGLTPISVAFLGRDKRGRPRLQVFSAPKPVDGELPLLLILPRNPKTGAFLAELRMDVWAAADYRDQLLSALRRLLPVGGPRSVDVPIVGSVDLG